MPVKRVKSAVPEPSDPFPPLGPILEDAFRAELAARMTMDEPRNPEEYERQFREYYDRYSTPLSGNSIPDLVEAARLGGHIPPFVYATPPGDELPVPVLEPRPDWDEEDESPEPEVTSPAPLVLPDFSWIDQTLDVM